MLVQYSHGWGWGCLAQGPLYSWGVTGARTRALRRWREEELGTIKVDKSAIEHLCGFFQQVDPRLGDDFRRHFLKSCRNAYLQGKAYNFSRGWRDRTLATVEDDLN
jgi:hypothetical protein